MHLSLERLITTTALLGLVLTIMPQILLVGSSNSQPASGSLQGFSELLLDLWIIDLVAISVSVEHVALTLSIIPFLVVLPTLLMISMTDCEMFLRTLVLATVTFGFIVARYVANSL